MDKTKSLISGELIVAVDFDGTITTDPNMSSREFMQIQPGCKRVLKRLHQADVKLILWTCRTGWAMECAQDLLQEEGLLELFTAINDHTPEVIEKYAPNVSRKIGADFYIDDKTPGLKIDWDVLEEFFFGEVTEDD